MIVDTRESTTPFFHSFIDKYKVEYVEDVLPFDYLFMVDGRILGVERKEIGDFASSLYSGRLYEQVRVASNIPDLKYTVLVYGSIYESVRLRHNNPFVLMSALVSLFAGWGVNVLFIPNVTYTYMLLYSLYKRELGVKSTPKVRVGSKIRDPEDGAVYFLCGLPHVGPKTARKLLAGRTTLDVVNQLATQPLLPERYLEDIRGILGFKLDG